MINLDTIEREINELEARGETTYSLCERLAYLYIVRDHLRPVREDTRKTQELSGSEFLELSSGVNYPQLMRILDEHMTAVRIVQPAEYEAVMDKIKAINQKTY